MSRLNVLIFFQQFEAQNVPILFLTAIYSFMVENRLQRPSVVYVCPVFSSRTCVHARHVILMVLDVLYQVIINNKIYLTCDALCDDCSPRSFAIFSFYAHFAIFSFFINFHFSLKLFLICSYFSGDSSLTVLIKCVLNKKKVYFSLCRGDVIPV